MMTVNKIEHILIRIVSFLFLFYFTFTHCCIVVQANEYETLQEKNDIANNSIVEISEYSIVEGYIDAGKDATIALTLHNANKFSSTDNIVVMISSNSGMVYPAYGIDNQFFVGSLNAGESITIDIPITTNSYFSANYADLICKIIYETGGKTLTNEVSIILPSNVISPLVVKNVQVSAHAIKNGKSLLSINYGNNSDVNINDAVLVINGNVNENSSIIELDTIKEQFKL